MNTLLEDEVKTIETTDKGWKIVIFNDDFTPYDVVVMAIQKGANLSEEIAEMICKEAHTNGSAVVRNGLSQEDAERRVEIIVDFTKLGGLFQGVKCEAQKDE